jgi:hypothetical protein
LGITFNQGVYILGEKCLISQNLPVDILDPVLFLLFINDIVIDIKASIKLFADDTSFYVTVDTPQTAANIINRDLEKIHQWSVNWLVKFNPQKTETMVISRKLA